MNMIFLTPLTTKPMLDKIKTWLSQEPVAIAGSAAALLNAAVIAAPVFGLDLGFDETGIAEIEGSIVVLMTLVGAFIGRSQVVPQTKLKKLQSTGAIAEAAARTLGL